MPRHDAVSSVADRLKQSPPLSAKILEKARNELRIFQLHNPPGTFGKCDNQERRAGALLEYVAREQEGLKLSMQKLAKACFAKEKEFVKFHSHVGNFRYKPPQAKDSSNDKQRRQSSIPSLAMKLGSYVADSNGAAIRAQRLLHKLIRFYHKRPDYLKDIDRLFRTYEAACFYIVATQQDMGRINNDTTNGENDKQLSVATVVDVSTDFTLSEFAAVLEHVQNMIDTMEQRQQEEEEKEKAAKRTISTAASTNKKRKGSTIEQPLSKKVPAARAESSQLSSLSKSTTTSKRGKDNKPSKLAQDLLEQVQERVDMMDMLQDDDLVSDSTLGFTSSWKRELAMYPPHFLEWKRDVLSHAIRSATSELREEKEIVDENGHSQAPAPSVPRDQALEHAARIILQSRELLVVPQQ